MIRISNLRKKKLALRVSIEGNETSDSNKVFFTKSDYGSIYDFDSNADDLSTGKTFYTERYISDTTTLYFGLYDNRSIKDKRVTMTIEILYDGKPLDNPESKLSFYWENLTP